MLYIAATMQELPFSFTVSSAPDGFGGMTATSVTSRSISLTSLGSGITEASFSITGDAAGAGLPAGTTYSAQGTASTSGGTIWRGCHIR